MTGALIVDKPAGPSSHEVVARVRRATGVARVGHTGTLDPMATGVLPLLFGQATRLARFLAADVKVYEARIRLGFATDTYDAMGTPETASGVRAAAPDTAAVAAALAGFRGEIQQTPPPFSAKKIGGVRAYELARRSQRVEPAPVKVTVHALDLVRQDGSVVDVRVACSSGFYVRSLAHDLGIALGCGAHLEGLRRVRAGRFTIADAIALDRVEAEGPEVANRLLPPDRVLEALPAVVLSEEAVRLVAHGHSVEGAEWIGPSDTPGAAGTGGASAVRLLDGRGRLLAVAEARPGRVLHPIVVLK